MITGLRQAHMGLAYLLVLSSSISLLLALANAVIGSNPNLVRFGTLLGRRAEPALMGIISILGIATWVVMGLPLATIYLWLGIVVLVVHGAVTGMVTKPALVALSSGDASARFKWLGAAGFNAVLILGIFGAMQAKV